MESIRSQPAPGAALLDAARLEELEATGLLDAGAQPALERFTRLACAMIDAPMSTVTLVDDHRQYFAAMQGVTGWAADARGTPLSHSFCQHVVADGELDVADSHEHPLVRDNLAVSEFGVRAYLGFALVSHSGRRLGALCTIDDKPRTWTDGERAILEDLAGAASTDLQLRLSSASNAHQARHDSLTGLANRRQLDHDLAAAFADRTSERLALLDLDGFKSYNDAFGHPAGDDLLRRIATKLREHAGSAGGSAYRMGGDEFCLLVPSGTDVASIAAAIAERTGPFDITASFGIVDIGAGEAKDAIDALQLVDERLYNHKYGRAGGSADHACRALLQALAERHPSLGRHSKAVTELAEATARHLELDSSLINDVGLTARLHDVGKVAVPDSILDKPGALDDDEWRLIHRHTVVGERILAATPALKQIAGAVRSTHERWDGLGYPDGLAGAAIPLIARIVFAADAYDAMTGARPYRASMSHDEAIEELRRCAGSQFDPAVIAAIEEALLARPPAR